MMMNLDYAEDILKRAYISTLAEELGKKGKNPVHEKIICRGPGNTYIAPIEKRVGRNDLCPCGSGKKYKKCCMEAFDE